MNKCKFYQAAHLYPFGMLSESEKTQFKAHMTTCEECAGIVREAKIIGALSSMRSDEQPAPGFEQSILREVKTRAAAEPNGFDWAAFFKFNKAMFPVAACLMCLLLAVVIVDQALVVSRKSPAMASNTVVQKSAQKTPSEYYMARKLSDTERSMYSSDRVSALGGYYEKLIKR